MQIRPQPFRARNRRGARRQPVGRAQLDERIRDQRKRRRTGFRRVAVAVVIGIGGGSAEPAGSMNISRYVSGSASPNSTYARPIAFRRAAGSAIDVCGDERVAQTRVPFARATPARYRHGS